ncbi:MAG TPA: polyprenol monophosphomannose synthase [Candidatus Dormibacteraeota bacterium]|nr:polyprenol monophosphomannose synthase [Candidatus Dormibacteraeota bacterium]
MTDSEGGDRTQPGTSRGGAWVVLPTYNERENLPAMVPAIRSALPDAHLLIVDDGSPDGTGEIADVMALDDAQIHVLHRAGKEGLGAAYRAGFREVLSHPDATVVVQMDCDFSHNPADLPRLMAEIDAGAGLVLGSRYVRGGSTPDWGLRRRIISRFGSLYARTVLNLPYRDLTGGYKAWRREVLGTLDLDSLYANGYGFQIEMTWRARLAGATIREIPIIFRDRVLGTSKMSGAIIVEALLMVLRLRFSRRTPSTRTAGAGPG